ncbi:unnamed protein product [Hymenolepis diminuta]|uniref:Dynein light chain n=1 Tax=Hymenolepis diminuta TaxID=6216 RepID=A0A0R3SA94_HYMDI|nr:unnamed protein product [Hymenolepis diminuta]VUZ51498.1 unnamed protein product [Hymenolepis diminuta]
MMDQRSAYVSDMEPTPRVFMVEKTDFRGRQRSKVMEDIRKCILDHQREDEDSKKDLAHDLKEMMDEHYGRFWHVVVGTDFSAFMSYCPGSYIQASYGDLVVLLFRLG